MSIQEREEYGKALALIARHGMVVVTEEHMQRLKAVVEAAREVVRDPYPDEIEHLAGTLNALDGAGSDKNDTSSTNQDKG